MKRIISLGAWAALLLALGWSGCASKPVREYEENTKRVVSEQPVVGGR